MSRRLVLLALVLASGCYSTNEVSEQLCRTNGDDWHWLDTLRVAADGTRYACVHIDSVKPVHWK